MNQCCTRYVIFEIKLKKVKKADYHEQRNEELSEENQHLQRKLTKYEEEIKR